jgi:hypothetical protein
LILRGVWQRAFVLEHLSKIAAINPPAAGWASNEVLGLALGRIAETLSQIFAARDFDHSNRSPDRTT